MLVHKHNSLPDGNTIMVPNVSIHATKAATHSLLPVNWVNGKEFTIVQVRKRNNIFCLYTQSLVSQIHPMKMLVRVHISTVYRKLKW